VRELAAVLRNRNMGLLLAGRLVSLGGDWIYLIALSIAIYRYGHGQTFLVSVFWLVKLVPTLILGPISGGFADRLGYRRAMILADISRLVLVGGLALVLNSSTWIALYPVVFLVSAFGTLFSPASTGIIPSLVNSREERLAANATILQVNSLALIVGSALGGVIAGLGYVDQLLLLDALTFGISGLSLFLIRPHAPVITTAEDEEESDEETSGEAQPDEPGGFLNSYRMLARRPVLLFAASVLALPELASGAIVVWIVPYSESHQYLNLGSSGVGYLYTALGIGAVLGGIVAASLGSSVRLDYMLSGSILVGGVALALFGLVPLLIPALFFLLIIGLKETVETAAQETLLQQSVPENMIGRASGTLDSFLFNMMVVGNVISGVLASTLGLRNSLVGLGGLIVLITAYSMFRLYRATEGQPTAESLETIPVFAAVSRPVREWAVRRMTRERYPAGAVIVRQGDEGDRFYTIAKGQAQVVVAGSGEETRRTLQPGDFFGEIALLHDVPRTATVRAETNLILWELTREDFEELQRRAGEFRESLMEVAGMRLSEDSAVRLARANYGV
jgi:MFS family permease